MFRFSLHPSIGLPSSAELGVLRRWTSQEAAWWRIGLGGQKRGRKIMLSRTPATAPVNTKAAGEKMGLGCLSSIGLA